MFRKVLLAGGGFVAAATDGKQMHCHPASSRLVAPQLSQDSSRPRTVPDFTGKWVINTSKTSEQQAEKLVEIMQELGTPSFVTKLSNFFGGTVSIQQDQTVWKEEISKCMYSINNVLKLDGSEDNMSHPINKSNIKLHSFIDEATSDVGKGSMSVVTEAYYEEYDHKQRIERSLLQDGNTMHVLNKLIKSDGQVIETERFLDRIVDDDSNPSVEQPSTLDFISSWFK